MTPPKLTVLPGGGQPSHGDESLDKAQALLDGMIAERRRQKEARAVAGDCAHDVPLCEPCGDCHRMTTAALMKLRDLAWSLAAAHRAGLSLEGLGPIIQALAHEAGPEPEVEDAGGQPF